MLITGIDAKTQLREQPHPYNSVILCLALDLPDNSRGFGTILIWDRNQITYNDDGTADIDIYEERPCRVMSWHTDKHGGRYAWDGDTVITAQEAYESMRPWDDLAKKSWYPSTSSTGAVVGKDVPGVFINNVILSDIEFYQKNGKDHAYLRVPLTGKREARITIMNPEKQIIRDENGSRYTAQDREKVDVMFPRKDWAAWIFRHVDSSSGTYEPTGKKTTVEYVANVRHRMKDEYTLKGRTDFTDGLKEIYDTEALNYYKEDIEPGK